MAGNFIFLRIFQTKCLPDTVEHRSIGEYSHVEVWNKDSVHTTLSLVPGSQHRIILHLQVTLSGDLDLAEIVEEIWPSVDEI
jgi:hypothetical protein